MMKLKDSLLQFPCSFPLKVLGCNTNEFHAVVKKIIEKHVAGAHEVSYSTRLSSGGKYMSLTATFSAQSRDQLMAIYGDLNSHHLVIMTL